MITEPSIKYETLYVNDFNIIGGRVIQYLTSLSTEYSYLNVHEEILADGQKRIKETIDEIKNKIIELENIKNLNLYLRRVSESNDLSKFNDYVILYNDVIIDYRVYNLFKQ